MRPNISTGFQVSHMDMKLLLKQTFGLDDDCLGCNQRGLSKFTVFDALSSCDPTPPLASYS